MSLSVSAPRHIRIVVISDFVCPFCYIGNEVLQAAIKKCEADNLTFNIEYRPYRLIADGSVSEPRQEFMRKKLGERYEPVKSLIKQMADQYGISIQHTGVVGEPVPAHRLCTKAYKMGGQTLQQAVLTSIFESYFGEAQSMDPDILVKIAAKHDMMTEDEARTFLASKECEEEVAASIAFARKAGIKGVPFTVIENKWALSGVQQEDAFIQIFKKLAQCSGSLESCPGTPSLASLALPAAARVQVQ